MVHGLRLATLRPLSSETFFGGKTNIPTGFLSSSGLEKEVFHQAKLLLYGKRGREKEGSPRKEDLPQPSPEGEKVDWVGGGWSLISPVTTKKEKKREGEIFQ